MRVKGVSSLGRTRFGPKTMAKLLGVIKFMLENDAT